MGRQRSRHYLGQIVHPEHGNAMKTMGFGWTSLVEIPGCCIAVAATRRATQKARKIRRHLNASRPGLHTATAHAINTAGTAGNPNAEQAEQNDKR